MPDEPLAGRYHLRSELGRGAMSTVWLAEDTELRRSVAVKLLAPTADRQRFEREARAVAALSHSNIGALYDYGESEGRPYMVLEYLPGGSLEERLHGGRPLDEHATRTIASEIAAGLAHAHERGVVHRDLKPANVLFDAEGRAKLVDFGIARVGDGGTLTEAGTVLGTAATISPEQAAGEPAGPASDVYSFGVVLFRALTGRPPFTSSNALELVRMHRDDTPPSVASVRPDAPADLAALADASLRKDPRLRPADGGALLGALAAAEPETRILAPRRATGRRGTARVALAGAAVLLALLGGGIAAALLSTGGGGTPPVTTPPLQSLTLPTVAGSTSTAATSTAAATTEARTTTTAPGTTAATTTTRPQPTTTAPPTTTRAQTTTTAPATTTAVTSTTEPATTTIDTTTAAATTTTAATTTAGTTTGP